MAVPLDVDDAVEVEHRQVVRLQQRPSHAFSTLTLPSAGCSAAPTMLRWTSRHVITPPYVAKPLRLAPFRALMLSPTRVGDPASPERSRDPIAQSPAGCRSGRPRARQPRTTTPALYLHEYTAGGLTVRGLVGALALSRRATGLDDRAVWPHEGIHPAQVDELADRMLEMGMNPAPILLVHDGPAEVRALVRRLVATTPHREYHRPRRPATAVWAIDAPGRHRDHQRRARPGVRPDRRRAPPVRRLPAAAAGAPRHRWDSGLAMLVDQGDTGLFLGAIHRTLRGSRLDDWSRPHGPRAATTRTPAAPGRRSARWPRAP